MPTFLKIFSSKGIIFSVFNVKALCTIEIYRKNEETISKISKNCIYKQI
jgi:hypothetical protein